MRRPFNPVVENDTLVGRSEEWSPVSMHFTFLGTIFGKALSIDCNSNVQNLGADT